MREATHRNMISYRLWAPAKVNLYLRVVGRRDDGYHFLESIVAPISVFDRVTVRVNRTEQIRVRVVSSAFANMVPEGEKNVAYRAAQGFFAALCARRGGNGLGADIEVEKYIPVGAGLGGGSSDAAAVLLALNSLLGLPLEQATLAQVAVAVGADVPCLLLGSPARVSGIGEVLEPVPIPKPTYIVACYDGKPLLTRDVFRTWDVSLTAKNDLSRMSQPTSPARWSTTILHNDLEAAATHLRPEIARMKQKLREVGIFKSAMSGSGSAVFGLCRTMRHAREAAAALREAGYWAESARVLESAWADR